MIRGARSMQYMFPRVTNIKKCKWKWIAGDGSLSTYQQSVNRPQNGILYFNKCTKNQAGAFDPASTSEVLLS